MSSEDKNQKEQGQSEGSLDKQNKPDSSSSRSTQDEGPPTPNNSADAQIQAHRKQHQQQKTKLFGGAGILLIIAVLAVVAYYVLTASPSVQSDETTTVPNVQMSESEIAQVRETFKQALTQYELNVQPNIDQITLADYKPALVSELALLKDEAVSAFARGAFAQAQQSLDILSRKSTALMSEWQAQIQKHVDDGQRAFNNEEIPQAQLFANRALALSPSSIPALELQNRIYAFSEASKLVQELKIAVFENNWPKQVEVITDIIQIDPERTELVDELANAQAQHNKQQLSAYLAQAQDALKANQLSKAEQLIQKAKGIEPNSKGAQALTNQINQAKASKNASAEIAAIQLALNNDEWQQVSKRSQSALAKHPNNAELKNYERQALQVLSAKKSLAVFVARPQRLADENIRQAASEALQSSFAASLLSPSLQQQIEQVASAIDQYSNPVDVEINSDGDTYITVVGVGHVGEIEQKIISLTPGSYVLQGKRAGYRNKRMEFTVQANTPLSLTLICDERI